MFASAGFNCAISRVRFNLAHARQSRTNVSYRNGRKYHPIQASADKAQVIKPINGDPFIGMLETPVTSAPIVSNFLSNLPAYRTGVSPLLRGVEVGLAHGFFVAGPFIKLGPLRASDAAEVAGCLSGAGLILILTACLSIYGATAFQRDDVVGVKTLSGRAINRDPLQTSDGWASFTSGWLVGGLSGVAWCYILTQVLPYYS
jgi:photosystem I subunit 11